jgi:predicted metal-dependent peptidase
MDIEQIKRELDIIRAQLRVVCPFLASLSSKTRIGAGDFIEYGACDTDGVIWIGRKFMELTEKQRLFVLGHEVLHAALQHAARRGDRDPVLWNLAGDAITNEVLDQAGIGDCPRFAVRGSNFRLPDGWEHWSVEQVYRWLEEHSIKIELEWGDLLKGGQGEQESRGGVIVQQGEPTLYGEGEASGEGAEDRQRRWQRELHKAWQVAKTAGKCPAGLDRWLENLLKPKTDVRALLRSYIREGLGRSVVTNWLRPSRKNPEMPWIKRLGLPTIHALVDTSGSIGEKELSLFLGTLQEFRSQTEITVTCWDAEAYETVKVRGRDILPWVRGKIKGGGGTVIAPALRKTLERMKGGDMVVVLTDGYIYDKTEEKTRDLMARIAARAAASVFLWTGEEVKAPGWRSVRLEA